MTETHMRKTSLEELVEIIRDAQQSKRRCSDTCKACDLEATA